MEQKKKQTDAEERQRLIDEISAEDLAIVQEVQSSTKGAYPVDQEWMLLAEFGKAYGWQAYKDARDDLISVEEMLTLIECNRKIEASEMYKNAQAVLIGQGSAQSKTPSKTFKSLTKDIIKQTKVQE